MQDSTPEVWRMKKVSAVTGYAPSTLYSLIADGKFPPPFKLTPGGRASGWLSTSIIALLEQRAATVDDKDERNQLETTQPKPAVLRGA
jgi:prophage regulatory protein